MLNTNYRIGTIMPYDGSGSLASADAMRSLIFILLVPLIILDYTVKDRKKDWYDCGNRCGSFDVG